MLKIIRCLNLLAFHQQLYKFTLTWIDQKISKCKYLLYIFASPSDPTNLLCNKHPDHFFNLTISPLQSDSSMTQIQTGQE